MMGCQGIMWRKMISSCVGLARCVWLHSGQNASSNVCAIMAGTSVWGVEKCRVRHYPTYQRSQKNALGEKISRYYLQPCQSGSGEAGCSHPQCRAHTWVAVGLQ